jgi:sugar phosphate isomerase/epimerase
MSEQKLIYHGLVSRYSTLAIDLEIMREAGFQGLEISAAKMRDVLAAGYSENELSSWLADIEIPGIGFLLDIERQGENEAALIREATDIFGLAKIAGAKAVQVLTGPVKVEAVQAFAAGQTSGLYEGVLRLPRAEQLRLTAINLARLADLAAESGLLLYLESLAWTPLNKLTDQIELIERAGRDNVRLIIDFWHCYASGDTPERVTKINKDLIYGVHVCDSLLFTGGTPNEVVLRDVPTGSGVLNLREWADAVKSTGYQGWWSCELFCRRQQLGNSFQIARELKELMTELVS